MSEQIQDLLKRLCETPGPPGHEQQVRELIAGELKPYCRELREDPLGNLIARVGAEDGYRVGVLAHMDEVGLIVTRITDSGQIGFDLVGMIDERALLAREVDIINTEGKLVRGIIGAKSRHIQTAEEQGKIVPYKQLWIDIGASSYSEVLAQGIDTGCGIVYATKFDCFPSGVVKTKAYDDRVSCAVLIEALKTLKSDLKNVSLYGMFTMQEEIGAKGARVVAFDIRPRMTITLDTVPTENPDKLGTRDVDINRGPVIRIFDYFPATTFGMFAHPAILARLLQVAQEGKIKHQKDVLASTYLDSSQAHLTAGGIPGGAICFPRRYAHSAIELGHLNDVKGGLELLVRFIESLDAEPIEFGKTY